MKYTQIPQDTFEHITLNAGVLVESFTPDNGEFEKILGATSGGLKFKMNPKYKDFGANIDNCPKNAKELMKLDDYEIKLSGSFITVTADTAAQLIGPADVSGNKVTPRKDLKDKDFKDLWLIADYSDKNGEKNGGFLAIHMMNTLSTGGFAVTTTDKEKGKFDFEFTAHYSLKNQSVVPCEIFVREGQEEA